MKDAFCSHCGHKYDDVNYPKSCINCGATAYDNPLPVAVCVQPVVDAETGLVGLAVAKRAIEPRFGTWNLLAGHMENTGETVEEAAVREFTEETGLLPGALVGITKSYANGPGHVLIAVEFEPITTVYWRTARLCEENSEFGIWYDDGSLGLGFPLHAEMAAYWSVGEPPAHE